MILLQLFLTFLKIGAFTFGGGYAMLPLVQEEVLKNGWIDEKTLGNFVAVSESTPGPFAINAATFVGKTVGGLPGAILATLGVVLPSFVVILLISRIYKRFQQSTLVSGAMTGLKSAVPGLLASALVTMAAAVFFPAGFSGVFATAGFWLSAGIFLLTTVLAFCKVPPIALILLSAALGVGAGFAFGL